jgi:two-component system OmpR family response regulator
MDVLLVDDDADIRTIARIVLESVGGMSVRAAATTAEALVLIADRRPDVVLLDVMMPGVDGVSFCQMHAGLCREIPVIFLTARTEEDHVASYFEAGACGVISKPFDPFSLPGRVRAILERPR